MYVVDRRKITDPCVYKLPRCRSCLMFDVNTLIEYSCSSDVLKSKLVLCVVSFPAGAGTVLLSPAACRRLRHAFMLPQKLSCYHAPLNPQPLCLCRWVCRGARDCQIPHPTRISDGARYSQRRVGRAMPTCPTGSRFVCWGDRWSNTSPIITKASSLFLSGQESSLDTSRYSSYSSSVDELVLHVRARVVCRVMRTCPPSDTHINTLALGHV